MEDDCELQDKIEIPMDKLTKLIIEPNYGKWEDSLTKTDGIYFAMGDNDDDDDRKLSEISLERLEYIGFKILNIAHTLYERFR